MSCCIKADEPICPCGQFVHPRVITNPPGLHTIAYRLGDYTSFRHALLLSRAGETQLTQFDGTRVVQVWRPGAQGDLAVQIGDLAVQIIEWWAYLADVLTFYNERVANQAYLRTADLPESVNRLIRLLGYRPRPGIGAVGTLAALATGPNPFTLPVGFQVQSKPGPGQQPQVFELQTAVTITPPIGAPGTSAVQGTAAVTPAPVATAPPSGPSGSVVVAGTTSAVKPGDRVLILPIPTSSLTGFAVATAMTVTPGKDALGNAITTIALDNISPNLPGNDVTQLHLLRSSLSSQVWQYPADPSYVILEMTSAVLNGPTTVTLQIDLASIVRGLQLGDPIVFDGPDADKSLPQSGKLISSTEAVWYANPSGYDPSNPSNVTRINPAIPPPPTGWPPEAPLAIPIPHTRITFEWSQWSGPVPANFENLSTYLIRYGWKDVGNLIVSPSQTVGGTAVGNSTTPSTTSPVTLQPSGDAPFTQPSGTKVLVQDVNGNGACGVVDGKTSMHLVDPVPFLVPLVPPLQVLFNLLKVTRGKTVAHEVLGSGNTLVAGQDFVLQNAPVTYLQSADSKSGDNYSSTIRVRVNQQEWKEVRNFYRQPRDAQVFITREDEQGRTHVVFGDGKNGARLPTGINNVVASYRYGSGAAEPAAGSLTVVLQPQPGLRAIRNPVAVGGGADPDPPDQIRRLAPRSVLTFDRAISVDDFEVIAAQAPGVTRAKAAVAFDPLAQWPRVTVWVGDGAGAVTAAQAAFAASADPNRQPRIVLAQAVVVTLGLTIVYNPRHGSQAVHDAVHMALVDPDAGLLGLHVVGISQVVSDSQVYAACLAVPGVVAVHSLRFAVTSLFLPPSVTRFRGLRLPRVDPAKTREVLEPKTPWVQAAPPSGYGQRHDPGEGAYLFLPDDDHLHIAMEPAP